VRRIERLVERLVHLIGGHHLRVRGQVRLLLQRRVGHSGQVHVAGGGRGARGIEQSVRHVRRLLVRVRRRRRRRQRRQRRRRSRGSPRFDVLLRLRLRLRVRLVRRLLLLLLLLLKRYMIRVKYGYSAISSGRDRIFVRFYANSTTGNANAPLTDSLRTVFIVIDMHTRGHMTPSIQHVFLHRR